MRSLRVSIDRTPVGTLSEGDDLWSFDYDETWAGLPAGFDLSPDMPRAAPHLLDGGTRRPVQWYFDNLLPEELLRQAISREAGIRGDDAFGLLEYLGAESAGSLTLLPPGADFPPSGGLKPLSDETLSARIGKLTRATLTADAPKRMSLAGAQHKLLVVMKDAALFEPEGATPSTHIVKPCHPVADDWPGSVSNEYVTMRVAAACGLLVPRVFLRYVPEPVYIVERFDRRVDPRTHDVARRHIIDACQLLGRARGFKHTGATLESLQAIVARTTNKVATRLQLFRWLVFNIAVGNDDCHLKKLSFFVSRENIQLAPHYDLLATSAWNTRAFADDKASWPTSPMGFELPGATLFGEVTRESVLEAGAALGVPRNTALRILGEVVGRLPDALNRESSALQALQEEAPAGAKRFLASESRVVRVMQSVIVPEMLGRLAPPNPSAKKSTAAPAPSGARRRPSAGSRG